MMEVFSYIATWLVGVALGSFVGLRGLRDLRAEAGRLGAEVADMQAKIDGLAREAGMPCSHTHLTKRYGGACADCGQVMT